MTHEFDRHIAVTPLADGRYDVDLSEGWVVGAGVNGGYQLAVIGHAISTSLPGKPDPITMSAYYLSPGLPGPARVSVQVRREGGRFATVGAELSQEGQTRVTALATYGDLDRSGEEVETTAEEIELPPLEECFSMKMAPPEVRKSSPAIMSRFDMRFPVDQIGWAVGEPSGRGEMSCWFRMADDREPDPIQLLMVLDAMPPVTFNLGRMGWAPTLELTTHVRAKPAPGWLKVRHATRNLAGGMFEEDCEVWDSAGRLVAQSRQLAVLPR